MFRSRALLASLVATLWLVAPLDAGAQPVSQLKTRGTFGTIAANGESVTLTDTGGLASLTIQTKDSYSGTWELQCSADGGTTYDTDDEVLLTLLGGTATAVEVTDVVGIWQANISGCNAVKVIATAGFAATDTVVQLQAITPGGGTSGGGGAATTDADDASIATGQTNDNVNALMMGFDGTVWRRVTFGTAGTASAQVWTVQGVASMTPILSNPGTATLWGVHAEDSAHASTQAGVQMLAVRQDSQVNFGADGDYVPLSINAAGELRVNFSGAAGGTSAADDADFADGITAGTPIGGVAESAAPTTVTEGDFGWAAITLNRALKVTLFSAAGTELTVSSDQTEDVAHSTGATGPAVLARRIDTPATSAGSSGDYATFDSSPEGALYTTPIATAGVSAGCTPHSIISAATVNETAIKASAGNLYWLNLTNNGASEVFFKLYNDTTANIDETDTPVLRMMIPGNAAGAGNTASIPVAVAFSTAITYRITGAIADNDTTAIAANEVLVSACFK